MSKQVFITGATSGLGLSHAIYLSYKGYRVIGTSRDASKVDISKLAGIFRHDHQKFKLNKNNEKLTAIASKSLLPSELEDVEDIISNIRFISLDVRDKEAVEKVIPTIWDEVGQIDVLVNNAGIGYFGPSELLNDKEVLNQFNTNYFGAVRLINTMLPLMRNNGAGLIINTSSLGGRIGIPYQAHYSASKAAISIYTESLRLELRKSPINVCTIDPGDINTNFNSATTKLIQESELNSVDLQKMLDSYRDETGNYDEASIVWREIVKNLIISPPPLVVSKKIEKIIKTKNPKIHYKSGSLLQRMGVPLMRRLFSENLVVKITGLFYGL